MDFGIYPPNADIDIPYRALIPRRLEQLLVAGKAFSLTHDGCSAPRMQRDLILLGGAVGLAAASAVRGGISPRHLDISQLQRRMVDLGDAPARILEYAPPPPTDLRALVDGLTGDEPFEWLAMSGTEHTTSVSPVVLLCCAPSEEVTPILKEAFQKAAGERRFLLARLLLWHRCAEGADVVLGEVSRQLARTEGLPERIGYTPFWYFAGAPDQGIEPETVFLVNALVRVKDPRVCGLMSEFVDRLVRTDRDYTNDRAGIWDCIRMVAMAAEHMGSPEFAPLLVELLELPEFRGLIRPSGFVAGYREEHRAYLVLCLARSLARCGQKAGLLKLAELAGDNRSLYARSAHQELRAITGLDLPLSSGRWLEALATWPDTYAGMPWEQEVA